MITGVAGFVGSSIARKWLEVDGNSVIGIDSISDYYDPALKMRNLSSIGEANFAFVQGNLNELNLNEYTHDVDVVFHQAGQPGVRKSWGSDFSMYTSANVDATQRLLEAAKDVSTLKRFVYASSSSVYGNAERFPTLETDRPQPLSPYGVTKLAAEHLCSLYAENFAVPTVSLRYFTVYGPNQRPDMAFTRFTHAAVTGGLISIFGSGEQIRDFTYIDDVVEANLKAALSDVRAGAVFNVAGGSNVSINDVLKTIEGLTGRPLWVERTKPVAGDVFRTGGDTSAIRGDLGWVPKIELQEGIARQLEWATDLVGAK